MSPEAERLAGVAATLGLALSAEQARGIGAYVALLLQWNQTYNLTALRDRDAVWTHHIADCLAVLPALDRHCRVAQPVPRRLLDVGSGGGLPGVLIALMRPELQVTCVDTVGKKAAFIRQAAGALGLPQLQAAHARVEQLRAPPFELITARAFASLADLVRLTRPLLAPGGVWMALKGKVPADEIAALPPDVSVFHVEPVVVPGLEAERCIVWMRPQPE